MKGDLRNFDVALFNTQLHFETSSLYCAVLRLRIMRQREVRLIPSISDVRASLLPASSRTACTDRGNLKSNHYKTEARVRLTLRHERGGNSIASCLSIVMISTSRQRTAF